MFTFSAIVSLALAAAVTAYPAKRTVTCGEFASTDISEFQMTAFTTSSNNMLTGSYPLTVTSSEGVNILSVVGSGATPANFTMVNSAIATLANDGVTPVLWDNGLGSTPSLLTFSHVSSPTSSAEIFCAPFNTSPHGTGLPWGTFISIGGPDASGLELCKTTSGLNAVVYNPTTTAESLSNRDLGIVSSTCFPAQIGVSFIY